MCTWGLMCRQASHRVVPCASPRMHTALLWASCFRGYRLNPSQVNAPVQEPSQFPAGADCGTLQFSPAPVCHAPTNASPLVLQAGARGEDVRSGAAPVLARECAHEAVNAAAGAKRPSVESAVGSTPDAAAGMAAHPTAAVQPHQRHSAPAVLSPASLALAVRGLLPELAAAPTPPRLPTGLQMPGCCSPEGPRGPAPSPTSPCISGLAAVPFTDGVPDSRPSHLINSTSDARAQALEPERSETPSTDIDDGVAEHSSALPAHWPVGEVALSAAAASPQHHEPAPPPDTTPLGAVQLGEVQAAADDDEGATDQQEQPAWDVYEVRAQATPQILRDPGPPRYRPQLVHSCSSSCNLYLLQCLPLSDKAASPRCASPVCPI